MHCRTSSNSRRQRAQQVKMELMAAYNKHNGSSNDHSSLLVVRHLSPSSSSPPSASQRRQDETKVGNVVDVIQQDPSLLWEAFAGGSTLMHWAAQHLRYEQINHHSCDSDKLPIWKSAKTDKKIADPWEWLLELATQHPDASPPLLFVFSCVETFSCVGMKSRPTSPPPTKCEEVQPEGPQKMMRALCAR